MGSVIDAIEDAIDVVVAVTVAAIASVVVVFSAGLILLSEDFNDYVLEELAVIMSLFGIDEEDIIEAQVVDQRLLPDLDTSKFITEMALEHEITQHDIIDIFSRNTAMVSNKYNNYMNYGENKYSQGLPTTSIHSASIPNDLNTYIDAEYTITSTILTTEFRVPTKEEYLTSKLHSMYDYYPGTNQLVYAGETCPVTLMEYDFINNDYDVHITRETSTTVQTIITITPFDATQDNKHTEEITLTIWTSDSTTKTSNTVITDVLIPIGSETDSDTTSTPVLGSSDFIINVVAFPASRHYIVKYYDSALTSTEWVWWVYQVGSGVYPDLDTASTYVGGNLELLPIIELRRSTANINDDKLSPRYLETKEILNLIGLDVDEMIDSIKANPSIDNIEDAYIYFGLNVKDTDPVVAKMMFQLFDFMYNDSTLITVDGYKAEISEGAFNGYIIWKSQTRTIVNGVIGPIGTYQLSTSTINVTARWQASANQYVEYTLYSISQITMIDRGGLWGTTIRSVGGEDTITIPLSFFFIESLTPLERTQIFSRSLRLSIYSAQVIHLEWYETEAFYDLVKVVIIIVAVVITVLTIYTGLSGGQAWYVLAGKLLAMYGASLAFAKLMETTDNPWLKAFYTALAAYAMYSYGGFSGTEVSFFTADQIVTQVTMYYAGKIEVLEGEALAFRQQVETALDEIEKAKEAFSSYISTEFTQRLATADIPAGYIEGPDLEMYKAIQMQYDYDLFTSSSVTSQMYDYDKHFKLGVLST